MIIIMCDICNARIEGIPQSEYAARVVLGRTQFEVQACKSCMTLEDNHRLLLDWVKNRGVSIEAVLREDGI